MYRSIKALDTYKKRSIELHEFLGKTIVGLRQSYCWSTVNKPVLSLRLNSMFVQMTGARFARLKQQRFATITVCSESLFFVLQCL